MIFFFFLLIPLFSADLSIVIFYYYFTSENVRWITLHCCKFFFLKKINIVTLLN